MCVRTCDTERSSEEQPPGGPLLALSRVRTDAPARKPGLQQGGLKLRSRIVGSDAGCYNHTPSPPPLLPPPTRPLPLPHLSILLDLLPSTPLPPPPLCKLLFIGWLLTLWPIRSTPPRCAGMNGPPCGPASPSWGRPPHVRGPDGRTDSRVARVDGGACRKRSLGGKQRSWWGRKWPQYTLFNFTLPSLLLNKNIGKRSLFLVSKAGLCYFLYTILRGWMCITCNLYMWVILI